LRIRVTKVPKLVYLVPMSAPGVRGSLLISTIISLIIPIIW